LISSSRHIAAFMLAALFIFASPAYPAEHVAERGNVTIASGREVDDLVVADGDLVVKGEVHGSVFVVRGDALFDSGSVLEGNVTVLGGSLWLSRNSLVEGDINVISGEAHIEEGAMVRGEVRSVKEVSSITPQKLAYVSQYILMDRPVPEDSGEIEAIKEMDIEGLRRIRERDDRDGELDLFDLGEHEYPRDRADKAVEALYRGHDMWVRVYAAKFVSPENAGGFWKAVREKYEEETAMSVHNSLGDGAHWYFRHRGASYCLWTRGPYFTAVMIRHDDRDPEEDEWADVEATREKLLKRITEIYGDEGNAEKEK